tara:strand:- start:787 stop:1647 length:861 start_codon:yes stop_codon:yes gene_type:complete
LGFSVHAYADPACTALLRSIHDQTKLVNYAIDLDKMYSRINHLAAKYPNEFKLSHAFEYDGMPVLRIDMPSRSTSPKARVIITAGVHGNEAIGTASLVDVLEDIVQNPKFRNHYDFVIYPAINPSGLAENSRYLRNGVDLNRTFKPGEESNLTQLFKDSLKGERFDLGIDMHEAYTKPGFFVIKAQEDDKAYVEGVLAGVDQNYIFKSPTGQYPYNVPNTKNPNVTSYVLESPGVTVSMNQGTLKSFFKEELGVSHSYTLEASGQIELTTRQEYFKNLVLKFVENF